MMNNPTRTNDTAVTWNTWERGGRRRGRCHYEAPLIPDVHPDQVSGRAQSRQPAIAVRFDGEGKPRAGVRRRLGGLDLGEEEPDRFALRIENIDDEVDGRVFPTERSRFEQRAP